MCENMATPLRRRVIGLNPPTEKFARASAFGAYFSLKHLK